MKYLITENRLVDFVDKFVNDMVGNLRRRELDHVNAREGDFELVDDNDETIFYYFDYELGVEKELFVSMMNILGLSKRELENLLSKWIDKHYPGSMVLMVYPIID